MTIGDFYENVVKINKTFSKKELKSNETPFRP